MSVFNDGGCVAADYSTAARRANDSIRQGVVELEKVIERLLVNNDELRRQRDAERRLANERSEECVRLTSENLSIRGNLHTVTGELGVWVGIRVSRLGLRLTLELGLGLARSVFV